MTESAVETPAVVADATDTTPDTTEHAREQYLPDRIRSGVGLALSGGGSRSALFHLGVLRRLNEVGVLSQVNTISSVSGGSIFAAHLAARIADWGTPGSPIADFEPTVVPSFVIFVRRNLRTPPLARRLLPWNWLNDQAQVDRLATLFETYLNAGRLVDLPDAGPDFIFCASDNAFAVNWIFSRSRIGDYQAGYRAPGPWTIGRAAAASSCFPPVFDPMKARAQPSELMGGRYPSGPARDALISGLRLSDGGLYDNLALEPIWKHHAVVIASDGGGTFDPRPDAGLMKRLKRYATVMGRQATSLRKRWLIASFSKGVMTGAYLGIGTPVSRYGEGFLGYSPGTVVDFIAEVRTDLDRFSEGEIAVLQNHGYLVAEAALKTHLAATPLAITDAPLAIPYPDWMDEARVRSALADSSKTNLPFGRGPWIRYVL